MKTSVPSFESEQCPLTTAGSSRGESAIDWIGSDSIDMVVGLSFHQSLGNVGPDINNCASSAQYGHEGRILAGDLTDPRCDPHVQLFTLDMESVFSQSPGMSQTHWSLSEIGSPCKGPARRPSWKTLSSSTAWASASSIQNSVRQLTWAVSSVAQRKPLSLTN